MSPHGLSPSRFAQVPDGLLADTRVSATGVRVYAIIVRYQGRHEVAWPGLRTIASDYGIPRSTVSDAVAELEEHGWLACERRPGTSSLYRPIEQVSGGPDTASGVSDGVSGGPDVTRVRNDTQGPTPLGPPRGVMRVGRKLVTQAERELAVGVLAEFNRQAGTRYASEEHLRPIVGRLREHPKFDLEAHGRLIRAQLADPWWKGAPGPQVIYGNAAVFERSIETARAAKQRTPLAAVRERPKLTQDEATLRDLRAYLDAAPASERSQVQADIASVQARIAENVRRAS